MLTPASPDHLADAEARYEAAVKRRASIAKEWNALGLPLFGEGSAGQLVEHPLVRMLREHDGLLDRLALPLRRAHRGPQSSTVVRPFRRITRASLSVPPSDDPEG